MNTTELNESLKLAGITPRPFYTVKDAATITGLSANTIYQHIYARELAAVKCGRAVRISATALASFLAGGEAKCA